MKNLQHWDSIYESLKTSFSDQLFDLLFSHATPIFLSHQKIIVQVDPIAFSFLKEPQTENFVKFKHIVCAHLNVDDIQIRFIEPGDNIVTNKEQLNQEDINEYEVTVNPNTILSPNILSKSNYPKNNLERNYTFKNFFYSHENKKVLSACQLIIQNIQSPKFNPFFLYGHSGIGKTHLVNAIGNELYEINPSLKILYINATMFLEEYTNLFKGGINNLDASDNFKTKYYNLDVLIFDDIQILEGKESTMKEFFSIFEQLRFHKKMVILTSDKRPDDINFEDRLISRFLSGLTLEIKIPDSDTKKRIFYHYAEKEQFNVDENAVQVFIENSQNVRALIGYLNAMLLYSINEEIDGDIFTKINALEIVNSQTGNMNNYNPNQVIEIVANYFDLESKDLKSNSRKKNIVLARHFAAYFLAMKLKLSHKAISEYLGLKNHSSATRAINNLNKNHNKDEYKEPFIKLSKYLNK